MLFKITSVSSNRVFSVCFWYGGDIKKGQQRQHQQKKFKGKQEM